MLRECEFLLLNVSYAIDILQIRRGRKPDGACLVVGSCCRGFEENSRSDVIYSSASVKEFGLSKVQYFWEVISANTLDISF